MKQARGFSIAQLLFAITFIPAMLMFGAVSTITSWQRTQEIERDVEYRGRVLATALAEGAVFGMVTGDKAALAEAINTIQRADPDLASLSVLDPNGRVIATSGLVPPGRDDVHFDQPIHLGALPPDALTLDFPAAADQLPTAPSKRILGTARIVLTKALLMHAHRRALAWSAALTLLAAVFCGAIGWWLSAWLRRPMHSILSDLRRVRDGTYDLPASPAWRGEIGGLQSAVWDVARALKASTTDLERTVQERTAELDAARRQAARASEARKALIIRSGQQLEEERKRIALEIHDELNASLVVMRMHAQHIVDDCTGQELVPTRNIEPLAQGILGDLAKLYGKARDIVRRLRPETLDALGLAAALRELARGFQSSSCAVELEPVPSLPQLGDEQAMAIYRCVQEAISNALKHSDAKAITIAVTTSERALRVSVRDDGIGFDTSGSTHGVGLIGMRERIDAIGGSLEINSTTGAGAQVVIEVPLGAATSRPR